MSESRIALTFSEAQLEAMRTIYWKYFDPLMPAYEEFNGGSVSVVWNSNDVPYRGLATEDYVRKDHLMWRDVPGVAGAPEWDAFADLMPYMTQSASISKMPAYSLIGPHIDRLMRPVPIYFPILGADEYVISRVYDNITESVATYDKPGKADRALPIIEEYTSSGKAVLFNNRVMHSVANNKATPRIAFGWNFKDRNWTFDQCKQILIDLGYYQPTV